jgi:hypothetical protein
MEKEQKMQQILEMLKAMQEKADADKKANQTNANVNKEDMLTKLQSDRKRDREELKGKMAAISARMDANTRKMEAKMDTKQAKTTKQ